MTPSLDWRGRLRRWTRWEYWPTWALYGPVALRLLPKLLSKPTAFTAANPSLPGAGIVGESKIDIQRQLEIAAPELTCPTHFISFGDGEKRSHKALAWISEHNLSFPMVLKPNAAQRGLGVLFAKTPAELENKVQLLKTDYLLQPKLPGKEVSLFFIRPPKEEGFIFSMTRKSPPKVMGDGSSNLIELARAHPRHRPVIHLLPGLRGENGKTIPKEGQEVQLSSIGAHCRGSTFTDGRDLITEALTQRIREVFDQMNGWNFGRFDLFAENEEDLRHGVNFFFIELNGVTSEATHIYDPRNGILQAWRTLAEQWSWAIRIGKHNQKQGCPVMTVREILALNRDFKKEAEGISE